MEKQAVVIILLLSMPVYVRAMDETPHDASSITTTSLSGSSAEMAGDDEVAAAVMDDRKDKITIDMLMTDHLNGALLSDDDRVQIREVLEGFDEKEYGKVIKKLRTIRRGKRGHAEQEETVVSVLIALLQEMKEHTAQMQSSGKLQQKAYEQQVASAEFARYKWRNRFWGVIGAAIVSNAIQFTINLWQASNADENNTNSSSC